MNFKHHVGLVLSCVALFTTGCVAADGVDGAAVDDEIGEDSDAINFSTRTSSFAAHGGTGGTLHTLDCGAGKAVVGFAGRSGSQIDKIGVLCAPVNANGTVGTATSGTQFGGGGGVSSFARCPNGQVVVAVEGRSGSLVDRLGILCSTPRTFASTRTPETSSLFGGGTGGNEFFDFCPQAFVLTRIDVRTGSGVNQYRGTCKQLVNF